MINVAFQIKRIELTPEKICSAPYTSTASKNVYIVYCIQLRVLLYTSRQKCIISLSIYGSIHIYLSLITNSLSLSLSPCLCITLSLAISLLLSLCLSLFLSFCLSLSFCLFVSLSFSLSLSLSLYLSQKLVLSDFILSSKKYMYYHID